MNVEILWDCYAMSTGKKLLLDPEDEVTVLIWKVITTDQLTQHNDPEGSNLQIITIYFRFPSYSLFTNYLMMYNLANWKCQ